MNAEPIPDTHAGAPRPVVVLLVGFGTDDADELTTDVRAVSEGTVDVVALDDAGAALGTARRVVDDDGIVPVVYVDTGDDGGSGEDRGTRCAVALHADALLEWTRIVLVTSRASLHGVDDALQHGAAHGMITRPWTRHGLRRSFLAHLATFLVARAPDRLAEFDHLLDDDRRLAHQRVELQRGRPPLAHDGAHPLLDPSVGIDELESRLIDTLDRALGHPPRITVAPGTVLIEEGEDVGGIYVLLDGLVRLTSRSGPSGAGERILHERSTGPILGLLSLASHRRAALRVQAATDVRAIPVTLDQLARAMNAEPELANLLVQVLITSLARRLRRSDELQVELARALAELSDARAQLVATTRFTAVGEMAAGITHELNNPVAALARSIDHLADDIAAVVGDPTVWRTIDRHRSATSHSTADQRRTRRALADAVGDRALAHRLARIGITDPDEARRMAALAPATLDRLEASARLGETIRTVGGATERIVTLVDSLRAYLRGDDARGPLLPDVDVAAGVDDALRLLSHRLERVTVVRDDDAVAAITARPGALQQVWTNLITNALDAMSDEGRLEISVRHRHDDRVLVEVVDDGPGIPADIRDRLFEPRFTTRGGRVQFGMGLGLSISRRIVDEHGGTIDVDSRPGRTVFSVELPRTPPATMDEPPDDATERDPHG